MAQNGLIVTMTAGNTVSKDSKVGHIVNILRTTAVITGTKEVPISNLFIIRSLEIMV